MTEEHQLSSNMEDYLEAIYHIVAQKQAARAKDIAMRLKVNNSSVTGALRLLTEKGYINYAPYDLITLTEQGKKYAETVVQKHKALKEFLTLVLGADEEVAERTACEMEHAMTLDIMQRMVRFVGFIKEPPEECKDCVSRCLEKVKAGE